MNGDSLEVIILNDHASTTGGSASVAIASAIGLAQRGMRVTLFTCVGPVAPQLCDVPNLEVICLGQPEIAKQPNRFAAFVSGWRNGRAVRELQRLLAHRSPARTIVHAHSWTKALSPFALSTAADLGFPLVVTLHDFFIACPNGGFFVYPDGALCARRPLSTACWTCQCDRRNYAHKLWRNVRTTVQNRVLRVPERVACYIGVSDFSANLLRPYLPPAIPLKIVRNPVDAARDTPANIRGNRTFVFIGRFEEEKGVRLFAEAVRATGAEAVFIGDGALMAELRRICPRARFTGWLNAKRIREHLRTARALVFPPLWYETLGLVVIEAAAAGVPAIISDRCAATDYIRHRVNGIHFARGSVESLSAQMTNLAGDPAEAARLGTAAYEWYWRDPWTVERHVSDLMDVYRDLRPGEPREPAMEVVYESAGSY